MIDPANAVTQARALQEGAERVLADLGIAALVAPYGELIRIGSAACGLMAARDIDLGVLCPVLDGDVVFAVAQRLFAHPWVRRAQVNDERPPFQSMVGPENEGIYCGVRYCEEGRRDQEWKIDLWYFPMDAPRPELPMRDRLLAASDDERMTILLLKHALLTDGRYGRDVHGIDIYRAVLDRGERSLDDVIHAIVDEGT